MYKNMYNNRLLCELLWNDDYYNVGKWTFIISSKKIISDNKYWFQIVVSVMRREKMREIIVHHHQKKLLRVFDVHVLNTKLLVGMGAILTSSPVTYCCFFERLLCTTNEWWILHCHCWRKFQYSMEWINQSITNNTLDDVLYPTKNSVMSVVCWIIRI